MASIVRDLIPADIDRLIENLEENDNEQNLLTLLHKSDGSSYYFLSRNLQGIDSDLKMSFGLSLILGKKNRVEVHHGVEFERKNVEGGSYFLIKNENLFKDEEKQQVIPFLFENEIPYAIVDGTLRQLLVEYAEMVAYHLVDVIEHLGKNGIVKGAVSGLFNKELKKKYTLGKEAQGNLKSRVDDLFRDYESPSTFIHPPAYRQEDRDKKTMFEKRGFLKNALSAAKHSYLIPLYAILPYSVLGDYIKEEFQTSFEKRFKLGKSKEEEVNILLSNFAIAHPKAIDGIINLMESFKHTSNIAAYATYAGLTAFTYDHTHWGLSYPMLALGSLSGLTMMGNTIMSHGRNSSGLISTLLDYAYKKFVR